ncbi:MAG TPA: hypothetical protein VLA61_00230 [Ideonella sp.]|uniref:hypothetical protein n=1 Tax=Ideonella sp. TaxID=1929293 RepID=UPI002BFC69AA|nr:hypothetical protein [Ideonella sp.]HSI46676.1 hypothetical protein [Ideonella sp.]
MNRILTRRTLAACMVAMALPLMHGCATSVKATAKQNPPPTEAFSSFGRIEIKPVRLAEGQKANPGTMDKIQANFDKPLKPLLSQWNQRPDNGRRLVIDPVVEQIEFTHGAKRVLLGPLAGSSGVLMRLYITDGKGATVATPEFFQRADAWAAGFVFGVHDNLMLTRIGELSSDYVIGNFDRAKGGPTGADDKAMAAK